VSETCRGKSLAPNETCVVNVGFKPSRTNNVSVARLVFNTNSDDAVERVLIAGQSTGDVIVTPGGTVPSVLSLNLPSQAAGFGVFQPMITKTYETAVTGTVTTTTGDATLSVTDHGTFAPGHLTNGTFALPQPLNARALNSANSSNAFAPLAEATGTATALLTWNAPVNGDIITIGFRQGIGASDVLRSGTYNKALTFSLSTTTP
jgi:hypothetical protein